VLEITSLFYLMNHNSRVSLL